ncbi:MAG TPA: hypothetical protein VN253_28695 [Kofleriaceae bacterium]|nr:hypothetical protein [Kofleriaceae bacterium]
MLRWWLLLVLTVASATARAQRAPEPAAPAPAPADVAPLTAATAKAQDVVGSAERGTSQVAAQRDALRQRLNEQLVAIDRLKQGPRGWRTKSQLEDRLSEANETRQQLEATEARLAEAQRQLAAARGALVRAIDAELAAGAAGPRAGSLQALRAKLLPKREVRRIVLPDTKIDPRLDPEELDEQVAAIREGEAVLERQIRGLEEQARELQRIDDLRRQHDRTIELDKRDDNTSRRNTQQPSGARPGLADAAGPSPTSSPPEGIGGSSSFESDAPVVLPEVVDPAVLDGLTRAQRSGDPGQRATAVRKARDAVMTKREQLIRKRKEIESLARQRRQQR